MKNVDKYKKYEKTRVECIYSSHTLHIVVGKIREKYDISAGGSDYLTWLKKSRIARIPESSRLAELLEIDPLDLLHYIVTGQHDVLVSTLLSTPEESNRFRGIFRSNRDQIPIGTYIKITLNSTKNMILDQLKRAKRIHKQTSAPEKKHRIQITPLDRKNINYYLAIENHITTLTSDRTTWEEVYSEKIGNRLIKLAIARTVSDLLEEKYGDKADFIPQKKEVKLQTRLHDRYYDFIKRYRLPTLRSIPSLLQHVGL